MVPLIELRGALPVGAAMGLTLIPNLLVSIAGNIILIPFIILFSERLLDWLSGFKKIGPFFQKIRDRAIKKSKEIGKYELLGLCLFVAIPLPGTGAWTGALIAAVLRLKMLPSFISIAIGVVIAGIIMTILSYGTLGIVGLF